ncbi:hypothetical protein HYY69_00160 [Candidatus Woesearchaeota archaeon]|nr:hypothetical protein [Candidatus Woesearchaeota archaeon]
MSNSLNVIMKLKLLRTDEIILSLNKLFKNYQGYFKDISKIAFLKSDQYYMDDASLVISKEDLSSVDISKIPVDYNIVIDCFKQGSIRINVQNNSTVFRFGVDIGYYNKKMHLEYMNFIKSILKYFDCELLAMGEELYDFDPIMTLSNMYLIGAKNRKELYLILQSNIKQQFNFCITQLELSRVLRKLNLHFQDINSKFILLDLIEFKTERFKIDNKIVEKIRLNDKLIKFLGQLKHSKENEQ